MVVELIVIAVPSIFKRFRLPIGPKIVVSRTNFGSLFQDVGCFLS